VTKTDREIMEILAAFDLTRCAHSAARLVGVDEKTVSRYVTIREAGQDPLASSRRARLIDDFLGKIEELVASSHGRIRADVVHDRLVAMGFTGSARSTRRAVAEAKAAWRGGRWRTHQPWIPEPGMWLQFGWGPGPRVAGRGTHLFCAWLSWSRYRVVIPTWDRTLGTLVSCMDRTLRIIGGAPTYLLTSDPGIVSVDRVAGASAVRPEIAGMARYYGCKVEIAADDRVPITVNLMATYGSFAELVEAVAQWCGRANAHPHRDTSVAPRTRLEAERRHLHSLPNWPHRLAMGGSSPHQAKSRAIPREAAAYRTAGEGARRRS
jgi:hypothetical protein